MVVTSPALSMARMAQLPVSATKRSPLLPIAIAAGALNSAGPVAPPSPSTNPHFTLPAIVVALPSLSISRMLQLHSSATNTLPVPSRASPDGQANSAVPVAPPVPSRLPEVPLPDNTVTLPVVSITLMVKSTSSPT